MNAKHHVTIWMILAMLTCTMTATLAQADNNTKTPAVAPAADKAPAGDGFEAAGKPAGEQTPDKAPADGAAGQEGEPGEEGPADQKKQESPLGSYFPFIIIIGIMVMWIFMGRSRKKKEAQRKAMLENLSKGDRVVTIGGIVGTIVEARETEIVVKVDDNTRMKFARWAVRNAGDAANEDKKKDTQEQQ